MPTLSQWQAQVDHLLRSSPEGYWPAVWNVLRLVEEVGELAQAVGIQDGRRRLKEGERPASVSEEVGDILFVLLALANQWHLDLDATVEATVAKVAGRLSAGRQEPD